MSEITPLTGNKQIIFNALLNNNEIYTNITDVKVRLRIREEIENAKDEWTLKEVYEKNQKIINNWYSKKGLPTNERKFESLIPELSKEELLATASFNNAVKNTISLKQLKEKGLPDIKWIVKNLVPSKGITIFAGTSGSYKTYISMDLALCVATGSDFLGQFDTEQGSVLYIDEENGLVLINKRYNQLCSGKQLENYPDNLQLLIFEGIKIDGDPKLSILEKLIDHFKPSLLIIDSMVRCMTGQEDKSSDVRKVFENLKPILATYDLGIVILHHTTKKNKGDMASIRGSSDFSAFADCILMFSNKNKGFIEISLLKNRHIDISELSDFVIAVKHNNGILADHLIFDYFGLKNKVQSTIDNCKEEIMLWIREDSIESFLSKTAEDYLKHKGYKKNTVFEALKEMIDEHKLSKPKKGFYLVNKMMVSVEEEEIDE